MKRTGMILSMLIFSISMVFAQGDNALATKQAELQKLQAERDAINGTIAGLESQINSMMPVKDWKTGGIFGVNFNQLALVNWAAGGDNSISGTLLGTIFANYKKDKHSWDNTLDAQWGIIRSGGETRKNTDQLIFNTKYGYKIAKHWNAAILGQFLSQFTETLDEDAPGTPRISKFGAPAYFKLGVGADYKPNDWFSLFISPATGKFTIVLEDPEIDETVYGLMAGETIRSEFGALARAAINKEIVKNINLITTLELFNNYTDSSVDPLNGGSNRGNIDVDWQTTLSAKINKYITASIFTHVLYDHDTKIGVDDDGDDVADRTAPRTQFKEVLGVGFSYSF